MDHDSLTMKNECCDYLIKVFINMNKHGLPQVKPSSLKSIYYIRHRLLFAYSITNKWAINNACAAKKCRLKHRMIYLKLK